MTVKFLEVDRPTSNGTIYPAEVVQYAVDLYFDRFKSLSPHLPPKLPIFKKVTMAPTKEDMVGLVDNVRIEDGYLQGEVAFLESYISECITENKSEFCIRPIGLGSKDPLTNVVMNDYKIIGMALVFPK